MARIALRAYQREIEELIETHQYDQAIAHCKHILKFYPKEIHSYRLLGKAYLESQRYGDASDIFMRVLSSVPDDFVSHVGMSIIREDEGNLDDAIWHMERGFEAQPANSAIQAELRRIHGRREGIEPPKIRLTRGALARMYIKGELYSQAIAELRAGLHEHPKRYDLQVALANAYYISGQRVDAVDICSNLLKALPYCLAANHILSEILSESERAQEAQVYAERVYNLDPYAAHTTPATPTADLVPEAAVTIEKLEWRPGTSISETLDQPEWAASLGVSFGDDKAGKESIPDWLSEPADRISETPSGTVEPFTQLVSNDTSDNAIPDWMQEAGWGPSISTIEEDSSLKLEQESQDEADELAPAVIPDWLHTMAPETHAELPTDDSKSETVTITPEEDAIPEAHPWLEETPPGTTDSVVTWLERSDAPSVPKSKLDPEPADPLEVPEWLHDFESASSLVPLEELGSIDVTREEIEDKEYSSELNKVIQMESSAEEDRLIPSKEISTTIDEVLESVPPDILEEGLYEQEGSKPDEISDWLQGFDSPDFDETSMTDDETDKIPSWLDGLDVGGRSVNSEDQDIETGLTSGPAYIPVENEQPELSHVGKDEEIEESTLDQFQESERAQLEDDAAFAWLESLAVKQGADEALLLNPDDRRDEPPDWIQSESAVEDANEEGLQELEKTSVKQELGSSEEIQPPEVLQTKEELEFEAEIDLLKAKSDQDVEALEEKNIQETAEQESIENFPVVEDTQSSDKEDITDDTQDGTTGAGITTTGIAIAAAITSQTDQEPEYDVLDAEMLFAPAAPGDALPSDTRDSIAIDEGDIIEGDTQPTAIIHQVEESTSIDGLETDFVDTTSILETVAESQDSPQASLKEDELPEWVFESDEQISTIDDLSKSQDKVHTDESTIDRPQELDDEEAFSWLETLAAKQQVDTLPSEESGVPIDEPPSWIAQALVDTEKEKPEVEKEPLPVWLLENAPEADTTEDQQIQEDIPEWLRTTASLDESGSVEEGDEEVPELPSWLVGIEEEEITSHDMEWMPSDEAYEQPLSEPSIKEIPLVSEGLLESEASTTPVEINQAGLRELEQLPGIGFVKAQAIMEYRDEQGEFKNPDELMNVSGIGPEVLENLKEFIYVTPTKTSISIEEPVKDEQISLVQARNALVEGNIALALEHYKKMIRDKEVLPEVVSDLNEALYRFPVDVSIWETLGDAHVQAGSLQEALNAYSKAEDYLK